jgi:hypothetical protein
LTGYSKSCHIATNGIMPPIYRIANAT